MSAYILALLNLYFLPLFDWGLAHLGILPIDSMASCCGRPKDFRAQYPIFAYRYTHQCNCIDLVPYFLGSIWAFNELVDACKMNDFV